MKLTRNVTVTIETSELVELFIEALHPAATIGNKERVLFTALGNLIGCSDVEAVKIANRRATGQDRIKVAEFRRWLPTVLSELFADWRYGKKGAQ